MRMETLVRVGGGAAIVAGVLRAAGSFVSLGSEVERQSLYFIINLLLLLSVFAAYTQNHEALGRWGAAGFSDDRRRYPPGEVKPRGSRP